MIRKQDDAIELEQLETNTDVYWRSLSEREGKADFSDDQDYEYTPSDEELTRLGLNRRKFVGLMGASLALTGLASTGCIRKPVQNILPYNRRPEEIIPGKPIHFATAMHHGRAVEGLVIESQEGRPTKVEGNAGHPMNLGGTSLLAQASVLNLYDPDRSRKPAHAGRETTWEDFFKNLEKALKGARANQGEGLALLIEETPSPTFHALLAELKKKYNKSRIFVHDPSRPWHQIGGLKMLGIEQHHPVYQLDQAKRVLSIGADFLGLEGDTVRHAKEFAKGRDITAMEDSHALKHDAASNQMNRLYVVESNFTVTGLAADHRLRVRGGEQGDFLAAIAGRLLALGAKVPADAQDTAKALGGRFELFEKTSHRSQDWDRWINGVAKDLLAHAGASAVLVGDHQPTDVHALGLFVNALLGNIGAKQPVQFFPNGDETETETINALISAVQAGSIKTLLMFGGNPVFSTASDLQFASVLDSVDFTAHLSMHVDETSKVTTWHVPQSHYLEAWGDLRSSDGTVSIQQPLIAPLYGTISALELLAHVVGEQPIAGYELIRAHWKPQFKGVAFESKWRRWLHEGLLAGTKGTHKLPKINWSPLKSAWSDEPATQEGGIELQFVLDASVLDGRYANNAWLQESPDPITKLTWDNAALINTSFAKDKGLDNGNWISIEVGKQKLEIPVYIVPGIAKNTIVLPLGYGRKFDGRVSTGTGFNVNVLRTSTQPYFVQGVKVDKLIRARYPLSSTQEHGRPQESFAGFGSLQEPDIKSLVYNRKGLSRASILRQASLQTYQKDPKVFEKMEVMPAKKLKSLWKEPNERSGHQWGMVVDLTKCTGCSVCVLACQSENNISVVGKERVGVGREMHWIRIDRYYHSDSEYGEVTETDDVEAVAQPMACVHCENAPCESVCPVAATTHSPEGLNDMAYNRCIGTRYCSNNCPYKVRRFNFFNYSKENDGVTPMLQMQRNPDVTVRFRGVMEKCSYCVQRINSAKIDAKAQGDGIVKDGTITPACAQACPSDAIVFGDVADPNTRVSKLKKRDRDYAVLAELNNKPRTTYLARIRNRNPELKINRTGKHKG